MTKSEALKIDLYNFGDICAILKYIEWNSLYQISQQLEAIQKGFAD